MSESLEEQDKPESSGRADAPASSRDGDIPEDRLYENIVEASRRTRSVFLIYLLFITYCFLAIVGLSDNDLFLEKSIRLPIVNVDVGLVTFFYVGPALATGFFTYFQLYLNRLSRLLSKLDTGSPAERRIRIYPWMINIARHPDPGTVGWIQQLAVHVLLWWPLPLVLLAFAFQYGKLHDPSFVYEAWKSASGLLILAPLLGTGVVLWFWWQRRGHGLEEGLPIRDPEAISLLTLIAVVILFTIRIGWDARAVTAHKKTANVELNDGVRWLTADLGYSDLRGRDFRREHLEGINFSGADLRGADFRSSYLNRANFNDSRLDSADFSGVYVRRSADTLRKDATDVSARSSIPDREELEITISDSVGAVLRNATFIGATMTGAILRDARLSEAVLVQADMGKSNLEGARLQRAVLNGAKLDSSVSAEGADFRGSVMRLVNISNMKADGADFRRADLSGVYAGNVILVNARLDSANLKFAKIFKSDLTNARLDSSDLRHARISETNLAGTSFRGARLDTTSFVQVYTKYEEWEKVKWDTSKRKKVLVDSLCTARSLEAIQPVELQNRVRRQCPSKLAPGSDTTIDVVSATDWFQE